MLLVFMGLWSWEIVPQSPRSYHLLAAQNVLEYIDVAE